MAAAGQFGVSRAFDLLGDFLGERRRRHLIERAVDAAYAAGIKPMEFGGGNGTADIAAAVMKALG